MSTKYVSGRVKELKVGITNYSESKESLSVIGIVSATEYYGDGTNLTGVARTDNINATSLKVTGVSTFQGDLDIESSVLITGITTIGGLVDINAGGQANTFKVEDLTDNRVVIAGTGGELEDDANLTFNGTQFNVGSGITMYQATGIVSATKFYGDGSNLTGIDATSLKDSGGTIRVQANTSGAVVTGVLTATTFSGSGASLDTLNASELDSGTVPDARFPATLPAISGANLTSLNGSNISTGTIAAARVATLNQNTTGTSGGFTAGSASNLNAGTLPDARFPATLPAASGANLTSLNGSNISSGTIAADRVATLNQNTTGTSGGFTAGSASNLNAGTLPDGRFPSVLPAISGANLTNLPTGINTGGTSNFTTLNVSTLLDVDGHTELDDVNVSGVATIASAKVSDLTSGRVVYAGAGGELQDSANLTFNGTTLTASSFAGDGSQLTNLPGIDTAGGSTFNDVFSSGINTLGKGASGRTFLYDADSLKFQTTGIGVSVSSGTAKTAYIEGPEEIWIDPHPAGVGTTSGIVRIRGDLYVDGKEVIIDVEKLELGDFQIGIASTAGTNVQLDGGGIGIGSVNIRKTITWNNATSALMSSENWNLASGKHYEIAGTDVLTATTLGSGVVNSSLTSVGTLSAVTVSGNVNANGNIVGDNATNITGIAGVTASGTVQAGDFNSTSDIRLKTNIQTIEDPLAKVIQIEGVSFNWKEDNRPAFGVIADQVQKILPELVTDGDPKTVNYNGLIGLLIEAVKEQQIQIDELKSKLP